MALAIQDINTITKQSHVDLPGMIPLHQGIRLLPAHDYPDEHTPEPAGDIRASAASRWPGCAVPIIVGPG
jgi:hypothetical protein